MSKKIRDMIQGKLRQCEPEVINIVAFGNPEPMFHREVQSALFGAPLVMVALQTGADRLAIKPAFKAEFRYD